MFTKLYPIFIDSSEGGRMLYLILNMLYTLRPGSKKAVSVLDTYEKVLMEVAAREGYYAVEEGVYSHEHAEKIFEAYCRQRKDVIRFVLDALSDEDRTLDDGQIMEIMEPINSFLVRHNARQSLCLWICFVGSYKEKNIERAIMIAKSGSFKDAQKLFELILKYKRSEEKNSCIKKEGA